MTPAELGGGVPTAETIDVLARDTLARLPSPFRESVDEIVLVVEDVPDADIARRLGLRTSTQLSGLYQGVPLNHQSVNQSGTLPERITLYRQAIIAEWQSSEFSLGDIVSHIVIHEIGHHFGFSDDDMHALEQEEE